MTKQAIINKAVIFDVGGVILFCDHMLICSRLANLCEHTPSDIYQFIFMDGLEKLYDEGKISTSEFHEKIRQWLKADIEFDEFRQIWCDIYDENLSITELIKELKRNDYRMYLLSNTNELHFQYIRNKFSVMGEFDEYILSYNIGHRKPSREIFKAVLEKSGLPPSDHIFIDDIKDFVDVAQSMGMRGIVFESSTQLRKALRENGAYLI